LFSLFILVRTMLRKLMGYAFRGAFTRLVRGFHLFLDGPKAQLARKPLVGFKDFFDVFGLTPLRRPFGRCARFAIACDRPPFEQFCTPRFPGAINRSGPLYI
jgi:hypothetical protein